MKRHKRLSGRLIARSLTFAVLAAVVFLGLGTNLSLADGNGVAEWNRTFGGSSYEQAWSVQQTSDVGYIIVGYTMSYGSGNHDVWLIKTDDEGIKQWDETFGGSQSDGGRSVQQTSDGGYIIAGITSSYGAGHSDVWLIKTNDKGINQWDKTFGGSRYDGAWSVQQTSDGGYIIAGITSSYGAGHSDVWLIKTDDEGNKQWDETFGSSQSDGGRSVQQTSDGGYIIAGITSSYGAGNHDVWLIKTNDKGIKQWDETFGGSRYDGAWSVQQTSDGGYIIVGYTMSYGAGNYDVWLIKTNDKGIKQWDETFGGSQSDGGRSVQQTSDVGYIIVGYTMSYGAGNHDVWLIKTDDEGNKQWDETFGGSSYDEGRSVHQTLGGGYIIAGTTFSYGAGNHDVWLIKVGAESPPTPTATPPSPTPTATPPSPTPTATPPSPTPTATPPSPTPTATPPSPTPPPPSEVCFIATAAYGTSTAEEIDTLRAFRDEVLLQNSLGSQLVAFYYEVSPPVADFISEHEGLRTLVRELLVEPVAWLVEATGTLWRN